MTIAEAPIKCVTCAMLNDDGKPVHEECYVPKAKAEHKVIFELPVTGAADPQLPIEVESRRYAGLPGGCQNLQPLLCAGKGH